VTEQEADQILNSADKVHVIPNDIMGLLRLVYNRQAQVLMRIAALDEKLSKFIEGCARDEVISPQTAADALDKVI
jgi:hypothetical protein